ncbi:MAG: DUF4416 family protein [SAR324 cluster bacterium]|nr:DUF4416 family protein [SAR324 cluster bacterium]
MEKFDNAPVKQIAAVLYPSETALEKATSRMEAVFSTIDFKGEFFPFVESAYYEPEMGSGLMRGIISFEQLVDPGTLASSKLQARNLENELRTEKGRTVNIDIGYLDLFKVALASFKSRSNKIYLSDGVWADWLMYFEGGDYKTFLWSFPDFKSGIYDAALKSIRNRYKTQLKEEKRSQT